MAFYHSSLITSTMNHSITLSLISQWLKVMDTSDYDKYSFINNKQLVSRDVTYFNQLKKSHHYYYYKKEEEVDVKRDIGREALLERVKSWNDDYGNDEDILTYARNGWKWFDGCLVCPECGKMSVPRASDDPVISKFLLLQISESHDNSCFWRYYTFDVELYYCRPYDRKLVERYFGNLKNLADNYLVVMKFSSSNSEAGAATSRTMSDSTSSTGATSMVFNNGSTSTGTTSKFSLQFINNSNRFLADFKENLFPDWVYSLALFNWQVEFSHFEDKFIVWLHCSQCHQKVFLESSFDPKTSHRPWCCIVNNLVETDWKYYTHVERLVETEENEGKSDDGIIEDKLAHDSDANLSPVPSLLSKKRPHQVDIEENLAKLKKLRQFFIVDEIDRTRKVGYS